MHIVPGNNPKTPYKNTVFSLFQFIYQAFSEVLLLRCYEKFETGRKTP